MDPLTILLWMLIILIGVLALYFAFPLLLGIIIVVGTFIGAIGFIIGALCLDAWDRVRRKWRHRK